MSLNYAPKVVTNGLVFYYDQSNTKKSWLGAPTTNLQSNPTTSNYGQYGPFVPTITQSDTVPTTYGTSRDVLRVRCSTTDWGQCFYWLPPALSTGTTYTVSFYARTIDVSSASMWFSNQNGSGDQNNLSHGHTVTSLWQRFTHTAALNIAKNVFYVWGTNGATLEFAEFQIEASSWATPFVAGIRTNTQAIIDLTGQNTITAQSLTYASDNTFSFNGSSVLTIPNNAVFNMTEQLSIEAWVKFDGDSDDFIFEKGDVNTQYSLFSHSSDIVFRTYHVGEGSYHTQGPSKTTAGIVNGQWVHIVGSWDGATKRIYINSILKNSIAKTGALVTTSKGASVGRFGGDTAGYYFNGSIAKVAVYNIGLTEQQVQQNFAAQRGRYGL